MDSAISNLARLARTLRPLRLGQLAWRGRYALGRRMPARPFARREPSAAAALELTEPARLDDFPDVPLAEGLSPSSVDVVRRLAEGEFLHLNRAERLGRVRPDWKLGRRSDERLWTVTLHYHAWAHELAVAIRRGDALTGIAGELFTDYLTDWIDRCNVAAPGARQLAWNSYAVATRIGWWVRSYVMLGSAWWSARAAFRSRFLASLWKQAEYLAGHLEWDLRGNHLLRDAVGLAWAGRLFSGSHRRTDCQSVLQTIDCESVSPPRRWLDTAAAIAREQVREQVLPDGGHFERSPMYHLHVMEDLRTLALLLSPPRQQGRPPHGATSADLTTAWACMAEFAAWLRHPDGQIPLFNDAGFNAAPSPAETLAMGRSLGLACDPRPRAGGRHFPQTGMVAWHGRPWSVFFDVGEVGPDVQPGHAHADTLSLECSYRGRRLFVDPGTYAYDRDDRRRHDRSTAAHNTVTIDGRDSSEVWHIFRVGRRAMPRAVQVGFSPGGLVARASHDGYRWLPGEPGHRRMVVVEGDELRVIDRVEGGGEHLVEGGWLLAPEWAAATAGSGWIVRYFACSARDFRSARVSRPRRPPDRRSPAPDATLWRPAVADVTLSGDHTTTRGAGSGDHATTRDHAITPPLRVTVTLSSPGELHLVARPAVYHPEFGLELSTTRLAWRYFGPLPVEVTTCISSS